MVCLGLYRELAFRHKRVIIPIRNPYFETMSHLLSPIPNVTVVRIPFLGKSGQKANQEVTVIRALVFLYRLIGIPSPWLGYKATREATVMRVIAFLLRLLGIPTLWIGYFGESFFSPENPMRFDQSFYFQAGVPFDARWSSFSFPRRSDQEENLFRELVPVGKDYLFLHEDQARDFKIDRSYLPKELTIVTPKQPPGGFFVSDYAKIIEGATQIHVIESSFAAFIEGLAPTGKLYAHRYARPEASADWKLEFTYKNDWTVLEK
jgi:hypothetical protein